MSKISEDPNTKDTMVKVETIRRRVESLRAERDQARGAIQQILQTLKAKFECSSLEEAQAKLKKLEAKAQRASEDFTQAFVEFEKEWGKDFSGPMKASDIPF